MRLLTELSLLSAPGSCERGRLIHREAIENFKGVWLIWARARVTASNAPSRIHADQCAHPFSLAASASPLQSFLCSHISSSILSHFLFLLCQLCIFRHSTKRAVSAVLHFFFFFFLMRQKLQLYWTQLNLHNWVNKETNQAVLLQRQALKQIKSADLLTLYFPSLF